MTELVGISSGAAPGLGGISPAVATEPGSISSGFASDIGCGSSSVANEPDKIFFGAATELISMLPSNLENWLRWGSSFVQEPLLRSPWRRILKNCQQGREEKDIRSSCPITWVTT